jgi:hypothetical protein
MAEKVIQAVAAVPGSGLKSVILRCEGRGC